MRVKSYGVASVLTFSVLVLLIVLPSYIQAIDNGPHETGLIFMSPEQERAFKSTHPRLEKVLLNEIALERINAARAKKGLPALPESMAVPVGKEFVTSKPGDETISGVPADEFITELSYVDNSWGGQSQEYNQYFPPIRTQGGLGSCASFATTYYHFSYTVNLALGRDGKDRNNYFSPKWTYNMVNNGASSGSSFVDNYDVLSKHGAASWEEFPYYYDSIDKVDGLLPTGTDYREWCLDTEVWRNAIGYRADTLSYYEFNTADPAQVATALSIIKGMLDGGQILTFGTYISSWQYTTIQDDESDPEDNDFNDDVYTVFGKPVAYYVRGDSGAHAMTIVGYCDNLWADVNGNGAVDTGEKGALRIANSWGYWWEPIRGNNDGGFTWLAYDSLYAQSQVPRGPKVRRNPAIRVMFYALTVKPTSLGPYEPTMLAEFEISHTKRDQLRIDLGTSDTLGVPPADLWLPGAINFQGGPYGFDGQTTSVPTQATFVFDLTDILPSYYYCLGICDNYADQAGGKLHAFRVIDVSTGVELGATDVPISVDNNWLYSYVQYGSNQSPIAVASADPISGRPPLTVQFTGSDSYDLDGTIVSYLWNFGDGSTSTLLDPEHTYSDVGEYTATLTVTDDDGAASAASVNISVGKLVCVSAHTVDLKTKGVFTSGVSTVTITECDGGAVVPQAAVFGKWLAPASVIEDVSGVTDGNGRIIFESKTVKKAPSGTVFTFKVLNVVKSGCSFQPDGFDEASSPASAPSLVQTESSMGEPYPNPGNPGIWLPFTLSKAERVTIRIHDMSGRLLKTLELGEKTQGKYLSKDKAAYWDGRNEAGEQVSSGIYFYTIQAGDFKATKKMVITR